MRTSPQNTSIPEAEFAFRITSSRRYPSSSFSHHRPPKPPSGFFDNSPRSFRASDSPYRLAPTRHALPQSPRALTVVVQPNQASRPTRLGRGGWRFLLSTPLRLE